MPDATLEVARCRMDEKMAAREAQRREKIAAKTQEDDGPADPVVAFEVEFATAVRDASDALDRLESATDAAAGGTALDACGVQIEALHTRVAQVAGLLPPATLRSSTTAIGGLEARLRAARERMVPKKKFAFKNRSRVGGTAVAASAAMETTAATGGGDMDARKKHADAFAAAAAACQGFRDMQDQALVRPAGEDSGSDFALSELRRCRVTLLSSSTALWIRSLEDCHVVAAPVAGAIYVSQCKNCTLVIAGRQIRIHTSTACDMYVHVSSHPILEHCRDFRFAPYPPLPPQLAGAFEAAGLKSDHNMWSQVNDFDWLKAQQSPHWCILPEEGRTVEFTVEAA